MTYLLVIIGASFGAMGRYGFTEVVKKWRKTRLPLATLWINWSGSFLLALLFGLHMGPGWYHLLGIGALGGFTTFSTLNSELSGLLFDRRFGLALIYFLATYLGGLILALLGFLIGQKLL